MIMGEKDKERRDSGDRNKPEPVHAGQKGNQHRNHADGKHDEANAEKAGRFFRSRMLEMCQKFCEPVVWTEQ